MLFGTRFYRSLAAGLACAALLSGCAAGQGRRSYRPRVNIWPEAWPRPFLDRSQPQPQYQPVPADPSGSPYPPNSPRGLYVPSGPAPESTLGLPVPPPLPPGGDDEADAVPGKQPEAQQPETLPVPPAADDLDVSLDSRSSRRPSVIAPPPPPEPLPSDLPRVAERTNEYDRRRQPVDLQTPEADVEPDFPLDDISPSPSLGRSPVEAFPQPRQTDDGALRGPGHTPPIEEGDEPLPMRVDPSGHRPQSGLPTPLPRLRDPDDADLSFPSVNQQMSGVGGTRGAKVEPAVSRLSVRAFRLTRDARSEGEAALLNAKDLRRGQYLVVQTDLDGLEKIQRNNDWITRITCHIEIRDAYNQVSYRGDKQSSAAVNPAPVESRQISQWLTIPARLKPGSYSLQLHIQDDIARQKTLVEMPVTIH